jgi:hypothetical protein
MGRRLAILELKSSHFVFLFNLCSILFLKLDEIERYVSQVLEGFPGVFLMGKTFPFDEIKSLALNDHHI